MPSYLRIILSMAVLQLYSLYGWAQKPISDRSPLPGAKLSVSVPGGFYKAPVMVELDFEEKNAKIYYTLDGKTPSASATLYEKPIKIISTQTLQAVAIFEKEKRSQILNQSYFIGERSSVFPIISITVNPPLFYDPVNGLMKRGPRSAKEFPFKGANFYSNKEIISHVEIFEAPDSAGNRNSVFAGRMGLSIFGGVSRIFPQKSFALYARSEYGSSHIEYPIFPDLPLNKYKRLVLRNSGSDFGETHFRDAFITSLGKEMGLEVQAYRPSIAFVNGRYHGVMNIREKLTKHYFEEHFNINADSIDLLESKGYVKSGSRKQYDRLQSYLSKNDLSENRHFREVEKLMDIDNFIEFQVIQIYSDNQDAGGNIKFWREQKPNARWRWILFDTDFGFGHYSKGGYTFNTLKMQTEESDVNWPNPDWSTFNMRMLMKNEEFRERFLTRFCDRMNSTFVAERLVGRIDSMANYIKPEMARHWQRWGLNPADWEFRVNQMKEFSLKRSAYMKRFLKEKFGEFGHEVRLNVTINNGGHLLLNSVVPIRDSFSGFYFKKLKVNLTAQPYFGFRFSHWEKEGQKTATAKSIKIEFDKDIINVKAVFVRGEHPMAKQIIINEISCRDTFSGDWIEFYNSTDQDLNLNGWVMKDGDLNQFVFPNAVIRKKSFLVLCREKEKFKKVYPKAMNLINGMNFGLGAKSDKVELYSPDGEPVDSVGYKIGKSKDTTYLVLVLRDFESDNGDFERNWKYERKGGSPGAANPVYLYWKNQSKSASDDGENLEQFMKAVRVGLIFTAVFILSALCFIGLRKILKKTEKRFF